MTTTTKNTIIGSYRDLMLDISEMDTNTNAFSIALKIMYSLRDDKIDHWQYDQLFNEMRYQCAKLRLKTSCEDTKVSLF